MKKCFIKTAATVLLASSFILTSCNDVIFDTIRDEVKLESAQISGDINSIVRYKDSLYLQNGQIWKKDNLNESHSWSKMSKPESGAYVIKLAADENYLYALTTVFEDDEDEGEKIPSTQTVWYSTDGSSWTSIEDVPSSDSSGNTINNSVTSLTDFDASNSGDLFCTNSIYEAGRTAYVNAGGTVYKLNGGSTPSAVYYTYTAADGAETEVSDTTGTASSSSSSCAYFNGDVYFSSSYAMETNGTSKTTDDATYIYKSSSTGLYWYDTTFTGEFSTDTTDKSKCGYYNLSSGTILSAAPVKDYILLGTSIGIKHVAFDTTVNANGGVPASSISSFEDSNASSTLSSYYQVWNVLAVDPSLEETAGTLYGTTVFEGSSSSTSATQDNVGLWAYFASRSSWNRE